MENHNITSLQVARRVMPFCKSTYDVNIFSGPSFPEVADQMLAEIPAFEKRHRMIGGGRIGKSLQGSPYEKMTWSEGLNCVAITRDRSQRSTV